MKAVLFSVVPNRNIVSLGFMHRCFDFPSLLLYSDLRLVLLSGPLCI